MGPFTQKMLCVLDEVHRRGNSAKHGMNSKTIASLMRRGLVDASGKVIQPTDHGIAVLRANHLICDRCIHPAHVGICTCPMGGTAYRCGCSRATPRTFEIIARPDEVS